MSVLTPVKNLITSPNGDVLLTVSEDHQAVCDAIDDARAETKGWTKDRTMKLSMSVPAQEYHEWGNKLGYECWEQNDFLKFWKARTQGKYCI